MDCKKHRLDRRSLEEKKVLSQWFVTIGKDNFKGGPMIDTIGQKLTILTILTWWINIIGGQHDR